MDVSYTEHRGLKRGKALMKKQSGCKTQNVNFAKKIKKEKKRGKERGIDLVTIRTIIAARQRDKPIFVWLQTAARRF